MPSLGYVCVKGETQFDCIFSFEGQYSLPLTVLVFVAVLLFQYAISCN